MKQIRLLFLFSLVATALSFAQSQPPAVPAPGSAQPAETIVDPEAQSASIRILMPAAGQMLTSNFVELHFELVRPMPSGEPNFLVQLDGDDPIQTASTEHTFLGLQPGTHTVRVTLVDANNSPIPSGSTAVQFKVPSVSQPVHIEGARSERAHPFRNIAGAPPAAPIPPELRNEGDPKLPIAGSPLPLLSLVGFGILIVGAAQTMRARPDSGPNDH